MTTLETLIINARRRMEDRVEELARAERERIEEARRVAIEAVERELDRALGTAWRTFGGQIEPVNPGNGAGRYGLVFPFRGYELALTYHEQSGERIWNLEGPRTTVRVPERSYTSERVNLPFSDRLLLAIDRTYPDATDPDTSPENV